MTYLYAKFIVPKIKETIDPEDIGWWAGVAMLADALLISMIVGFLLTV